MIKCKRDRIGISQGLTGTHRDSPGLTGTCRDSPGLAGTHEDSRGLMRTHGDSRGLTGTQITGTHGDSNLFKEYIIY